MDNYTALLTKAQDGCKVCWDSRKLAARQVLTMSNSVQNMITYDVQIYLSSVIQLVISKPRSAASHVTRNVAQNTRPSSHMWRV